MDGLTLKPEAALAERVRAGVDGGADFGALAALAARPAALAASPWLRYGLAWVLMPAHEAAAREQLALAVDAFEQRGDKAGLHAASAAMLIVIADQHNDFRGLRRWLLHFAVQPPPALSPLLALRSAVAGIALPELAPGDTYDAARVAVSADTVYAALRAGLARPADERLLVGRLLIDRLIMDQDAERFRHVEALLHPLMEDTAASPAWKATWWWRLATGYADFGDSDTARACRERAWGLAEAHGLADLQFVLTGEELADLMARGDLAAAARRVARLAEMAPTVKAVWRAHALVHTARYHLLRGEPAVTRELCQRAIALFVANELPDRELSWPLSLVAHALLLEKREDEALVLFEGLRPHLAAGQSGMLDVLLALARAVQARRLGAADTPQRVGEAMRLARALDWPRFFITLPQLAAGLFATALAHGIERDFVVRAIRMRALGAPEPWQESWPWALRIRALGRFEVEREDLAITFERKAQKKPLELLKALVSAGGQGVPRETLAHALWPDPDADALVSFDVTLSRLRKLLAVEHALALSDGKLSLNPQTVWCDTAAFELQIGRLREAIGQASAGAGGDAVGRIEALADEVLRLHRGPLFGDEPATPWSAAPRDRLAALFLRGLLDLGGWREGRGEWAAAIAVYERGLAQQPLQESLYRGLMRCHAARGESAEALLVFRRCRDLLAQVVGSTPGDETLALAARLREPPAVDPPTRR